MRANEESHEDPGLGRIAPRSKQEHPAVTLSEPKALGGGEQDLPRLESGQRGYCQIRPTHPMKITGVWENAEGSESTPRLDTTCSREDNSSDRPAAGQMLKLEDWNGKHTGVRSLVSWRTPAPTKTAYL